MCEGLEAVSVSNISSLKAAQSSEDFVENSHRGSFEHDSTGGQ
jgi:hypothetical protein